jgi:hypothetical protein
MANTNPSGIQVNIGSIVIKGAPAGTNSARLDRAIRQGLGRALEGVGLTSNVEHSIDVPRLRLQLPPRATEGEIAQALADAIAHTR